MDYENVCGICGDIIEKTNDEKLINTKLKCGHNFHYMCIEYSYNLVNQQNVLIVVKMEESY